MRQKFVYILVGIALVVGLIALPPAPVAEAGNNGQQLTFYIHYSSKYSGKAGISWLYIKGTYYTGKTETWSRTFNTPVNSYSLPGYWWKKNVEVQFRMADGRRGYCTLQVPESQSSNWYAVGVDRQPGTYCYGG